MTPEDSQAIGEVLRRRYGIDGTAGDAQDVEHPYIPAEPHEYCALCGLAPVTSKHVALPADMLRGEGQ